LFDSNELVGEKFLYFEVYYDNLCNILKNLILYFFVKNLDFF